MRQQTLVFTETTSSWPLSDGPQQFGLFDMEERTDLAKDGKVVTDPNGKQFQYQVFPELKTK